MLSKIVTSILLLATAVPASSPANYGPFARGTEPKRFPVVELVRRSVAAERMTFGATANSAAILETQSDEKGTSLVVFDDFGQRAFGPVRVSPHIAPLRPPLVYRAQLNQDRTFDYIVLINSGGNGIAACYTDVAFVVSSPAGYQSTVFKSSCPSEEDFVDIMRNGRFQYIQPTFVFGSVAGLDGKIHNYWVYNIYSLKDASFKVENSLISNFPKWIMYAGTTNHWATRQLSNQQKMQMWKSYEGCLYWTAGDPCASR
jgi:hypothetical protein